MRNFPLHITNLEVITHLYLASNEASLMALGVNAYELHK